MSGFKDALADFVFVGIGDVANTYQLMLTQDAIVGPGDGPATRVYETTVTEIEPDVGGMKLESYGPPPNDAIPGLDIG
jgi:hypothetical protein